jgi:hypothetical protein
LLSHLGKDLVRRPGATGCDILVALPYAFQLIGLGGKVHPPLIGSGLLDFG